ncbi:MAG: hypothetical protein PF569_03820 [Candidatus Woesearchaeota archaeon]|jgi:hypothetical protein|nr:hypothetical protein [Candidatus Woesearchaeota archaeon]
MEKYHLVRRENNDIIDNVVALFRIDSDMDNDRVSEWYYNIIIGSSENYYVAKTLDKEALFHISGINISGWVCSVWGNDILYSLSNNYMCVTSRGIFTKYTIDPIKLLVQSIKGKLK